MEEYEECECNCQECIGRCKGSVCWPTPEEAERLIDNGLGNRLMLDYWVEEESSDACEEKDLDTYIVAPAIKGYEKDMSTDQPKGNCVFLTKDDLCELHDLGLKPLEARVVSCKRETPNLHKEIAMMWKTPEGREVVDKWNNQYYKYK